MKHFQTFAGLYAFVALVIYAIVAAILFTSCTSNHSDWDPGYGGDPVMAERMKKQKP